MNGFSIVKTDDNETATVYYEGDIATVQSDAAGYAQIVEHLVAGEYESAIGLMCSEKALSHAFKEAKLDDRISVKHGRVLYKGQPVDSTCADYVVQLSHQESPNYVAFANFLAKLMENPINHSKTRLFDWLERTGGFSLTPEGDIVGYKGLRPDFTSHYTGEGWVNDEHYQFDHLPNNPGDVVKVKEVEMDPSVACSLGLHAGTFDYAKSYSYGGRMVSVVIDPANVVSVPFDSNGAKMRVSEYRVAEEVSDKYTDKVVSL